jgi:methyl-accepting chemotaxis protein
MPTLKLKIAGRVWLAVGACLVGTIATIGAVEVLLAQSERRAAEANASDQMKALAMQIELKARSNAIDNVSLLISPSPEEQTRRIEAVRTRTAAIESDLQALEGQMLAADGAGTAVLEDVRKRFASYGAGVRRIHDLVAQGKTAEAQFAADEEMMPMMEPFFSALAVLAAQREAAAQASQARAGELLARMKWLVLLVGTLAVLAGAAAALLAVRSIMRPLRRAVALAQAVSAGDLSHRERAEGNDEAAEVVRALNTMADKLQGLISQVRDGAEHVASTSHQIVQGNTDLSSRTEQQASSLEQTAASMEQMTSTVRQNAEAARQANELSASASDVAQKGGQIVEQVVATMEQITLSSRRIADITGVIDTLAFQTNMLALNAAVEAARAGEQGRGFAVVAAEVRALAQRSAQQAREIKGLIGESVGKVEMGSAQVAQAGQTMSEIVTQVQRVKELIGEITTSSSEQSGGIGQINDAVTHLDQMTQQNAALVEQSTAAAHSLRDQAQRLSQAVTVFRTGAAAAH